jgi:hypothetical protein
MSTLRFLLLSLIGGFDPAQSTTKLRGDPSCLWAMSGRHGHGNRAVD